MFLRKPFIFYERGSIKLIYKYIITIILMGSEFHLGLCNSDTENKARKIAEPICFKIYSCCMQNHQRKGRGTGNVECLIN